MRPPSVKQISLVFLLLHCWWDQSSAERKKKSRHFVFKDCGLDADRPIRFLNITARPAPIRAPGKVKLWTAVNVTRPLPEKIGVDVSISKYIFGLPFKIPCIKNFGTCHYKDVCSIMSEAMGAKRCPSKLRRNGIPCRCPIGQGYYTLDSLRVRIPTLDGFLSILANGRYDFMVQVYNESDNSELGCLKVDFELTQRKRRSRPTPVRSRRRHHRAIR